MIILDILFKICLAPVSKFEEKGKLIAVIWLAPILSLVSLAALNVSVYLLQPIIDLRFIIANAFVSGTLSTLLIIFTLQRIYLKNNRQIGKNYSPFVGLLILFLIFGSLTLFIMSLRYT